MGSDTYELDKKLTLTGKTLVGNGAGATIITQAGGWTGGAEDPLIELKANSGLIGLAVQGWDGTTANPDLAAVQISGNAWIEDCTFQNNDSGDGEGGAMRVTGGIARILYSKFISNNARSGGAAYASGTRAIFQGCEFTSNTALLGGAIFSAKQTIVVNSVFAGNSATKGDAISTTSGAKNNYFVNNDFGSQTIDDSGTTTIDLSGSAGSGAGSSTVWNSLKGVDFTLFEVPLDKVGNLRIEPKGSATIDIGPIESGSRIPAKFTIANADLNATGKLKLNPSSVTYAGLAVKPPVFASASLNADNSINEGKNITLSYDPSQSPGVRFIEYTVGGTSGLSSFLAGEHVTGNSYSITAEFGDYTFEIFEHLQVTSNLSAIPSTSPPGFSVTFPSGRIFKPGMPIDLNVTMENPIFSIDRIFINRSISGTALADGAWDSSAFESNGTASVGVGADVTDVDSGEPLGFKLLSKGNGWASYQVYVTEQLDLATPSGDKKAWDVIFSLKSPSYELRAQVDPSDQIPKMPGDTNPGGYVNGSSVTPSYSATIPSQALDGDGNAVASTMVASPRKGYSFAGWITLADYTNTLGNSAARLLKVKEITDYDANGIPDSAFSIIMSTDPRVSNDRLDIVALFEPASWVITSEVKGGINDQVPGTVKLVYDPDIARTPGGKFFDGASVDLWIRPDPRYRFLDMNGTLNYMAGVGMSVGTDENGTYYFIKNYMDKNLFLTANFELRAFYVEQEINFGSEGAIRTKSKHAFGDELNCTISEESGYVFMGWELGRYVPVLGQLEPGLQTIRAKSTATAVLNIDSQGIVTTDLECHCRGERNYSDLRNQR